MGASDSKLVFKQGIFKLSEGTKIPADSPYWKSFWELPESAEDVFSLFSPTDVRRTRDTSLPNLESLILALTSHLFTLRNLPAFPDPELAPEREALNCIRVLTRILPFLHEADSLEAWEDKFLWGVRRKRKQDGQLKPVVLFDEAHPEDELKDEGADDGELEDAKPLAEELLDTLIDLLFFHGFTLPYNERSKSSVSYSIWSSGVGCNTPMSSSKELEDNRTEVLKLLLAFASKSMYMPANVLPVKGVKAITYIVTCPDKQVVLSTLCSLLNSTLKYNPASWRLPYDHVVIGDPKQIYVATCLQFLLVLILYPIPEEGKGHAPKNYFRHFLGRLHRPQDFQFLVDGMTRILHQPLQVTSSYLPGSQKPLRWAPEMIMLFWETIQCNKRFRSFIVDTDRGHDFVILVLFYALEYRTDPTKQGIVRMCVFVLQTLSAEDNFGNGLNKKFERQETLPTAIKIDNFSGTYADFLISSIHTLITGSKGKLDAIYPALLAIINNIAAYLENLNSVTSLKLLQLFSSMSSPSFLLANENNHILLTSLLESMNAIIEHRYEKNPRFVLAILKHRKRFEALRSFTLESGQEEIERLSQLRKDSTDGSEQAISPLRSPRNGSIDSLRSPVSARTPSLSNVPEEDGSFAIGDDDSDDEDHEMQPTPSQSSLSNHNSRTPSVSSSVDDAVPLQLRGMSEKARGKMPVGQPSFSRVNSMTSISSHTAVVPASAGGFAPSAQWIDSWLPSLPLHTILTLLSSAPNNQSPKTLPDTIDTSSPRIHLFEWSPLSLGWYESLLWSFIFSSEMATQRGTAGIWNSTNIRLFKVEKEAARGPSLMKPMGAVDAVGSNLVQRIGSLTVRGGPEAPKPTTGAVRDV
ncbi:hypothetical protein MMC26_006981 [Xylographa opegraphella]|nr:hypothetical protein [Xylographa opegraphella]